MHKYTIGLIFCSLTVFCYASSSEVPEPYCSIRDLPFDGHGWFLNSVQMESCLNEREIKTVIEVGSWLGTSTRFLAEKIPPTAKVYAVDTWAGSPNEAEQLKDPRMPYLYQLFLSNVKHANLAHKIIPVRMNSLEASRALNVKADLIYIDASHDEESVYQDILAWSEHLASGGIMTGDDWACDAVRRGVVRAAAKLNKTIHGEGNFWRFIEPSY